MAGEVIQHLAGEKDPWFARNSGKAILAIVFLLLAALMGFVPSPVSRAIDTLSQQHLDAAAKITVQCVHDATTDLEREECITGVLRSHPVVGSAP